MNKVLRLTIALGIIFIIGCSDDDKATAVVAAVDPTGTWTNSDGTIVYTITAPNTFSYSELEASKAVALETGTWAVSGTNITFTAVTCTEDIDDGNGLTTIYVCDAPETMAFTVSGATFTLTVPGEGVITFTK